MKEFVQLRFDIDSCRAELAQLRQLLDSAEQLEERKVLLPFFRQAPHLSAFIGSYFPYIERFDRIAYEYSLSGDFACDLVVGDARRQAFCFIEFEDARTDSIFVQRTRSTPEWSPRFEHGFSQLVDWMWTLDDTRGSTSFLHRFGTGYVRMFGMLIIGRGTELSYREQQRLNWRLERVLVDSKQIFCITYDQLLADLTSRLATYQLASGSA